MKLLKKASILFCKNIDLLYKITFPPCCLICGKLSNKIWCKDCKNKLYKNAVFKVNNINNSVFYFDKHIYIYEYKNEIRNIILDYKFKDKSYLYKIFSEIIIKNEKIYRILKKYDIMTSVPIHKKRKKQRGYNQSELIARDLAKQVEKIEYKNLLNKSKNNNSQSMLSKKEREENVKGVYEIINSEKIKNKRIIIFDDIYTTGNTINECSKILKQNGAKEVLVLTIAKD